MTSTNDGKDVKSNQTSGPKGKTYYIELYKSLEAGLSGDCEFRERTQHLCEAWRRIHSLCQHSAPSTHPHLLSWLQRHTARLVLQTEWQSPKSKEEHSSLEEAINAFIKECSEHPGGSRDAGPPPWEVQLVARGEWFKKILENPWGHPVLRALLDPRGEPPSDQEVLEWLKEERGVMFVTRLRQLAASKCDDLALALSSAVMQRVRSDRPPADADGSDQPPSQQPAADVTDKSKADNKPSFEDILKSEAGFTVDVWELLTDIEFVLLHKRDKRARCIELAKQTPLRNGYQLVERLQSRLDTSPREKKLWKNAKEVATLIAQVIITRCMVVPTCAGAARTALYCCARSLVRALGSSLPCAARALAAPASTARHLHTLAAAVDAHSTEDMKPFVCELYVRAITAGMNELERLKLKTEKEEETRSAEQTLASWFSQLGALLSASERLRCECLLTAFSVHPTPASYERIKAAPPLASRTLDVHETKEAPNPEFGSWASDSRSQTNFVKTSETLNLKHTQNRANVLSTAIFSEGEALGISPELCTDIAVLLSGPRLKTLSGNILKLIESYLSNRLQCTEISRICPVTKLETIYTSIARQIKYGVPQGSILGPLLFLIYINDLPKMISQEMVLFADDSTAIIKCDNPNNYQIDINNTLSKIIKWLIDNNLVINLNKTKIMHFHQRLVNTPVDVTYNNIKIEEVSNTKFLGVTIDDKLTWKPHLEEICKRLSKSAYLLFQLSKKVNTETLLMAYHGLVSSVLRYGVIFWGQSTNREVVFRIQKRCVRSMFGLKKTDSCIPYFKKYNILPFPALYIFETALFVKKNPHLFQKLATVKKMPLRAQYLNTLCHVKCKTALMKKSFFGIAPEVYNKIPDAIKRMPVLKFKCTLHQLLLKKCYYRLDEFLNDNFI